MTQAPNPFRRPDSDPPGAWKRNPYVLMLVAIPASVVLMAAVMIPLAISSWDGVVADDYYKRGLLIGQEMARDEQALSLGLAASVVLDPAAGIVTVTLTGPLPQAERTLTLQLAHATRGGHDATLTVVRQPDQRWTAALPPLAPGGWHLELGNKRWRLKGVTQVPGNGHVQLAPIPART